MLGVLTESEAESVLRRNRLGRIGCTDDSEILIIPVTYFYKDRSVICHSFEGKKLSLMRRYPEICFEVEDIIDHQNWACVLAQGLFEVLEDAEEIEAARNQLTEMALKKKSSLSALPPDEYVASYPAPHGRSTFYKIHLSKITGRFERQIPV